jgi:copper chaperone CopZ
LLREKKNVLIIFWRNKMKSTILTKAFALLLALAVFGTVALAQDNSSLKEVKIKTTVTKQESKDKIETVLDLLKGVKDANLKLEDKTVTVKFDAKEISSAMIVYTINTLGYNAEVLEEKDCTDTSSTK